MSATKVLISGFEPFGGSKTNPSQQLVNRLSKEQIPGAEIFTIILPVEFDASTEILLAKIDEISPDVVISFGQAEGRDAITPEKIAINLDDAPIPDNRGDQRRNQPIQTGGADGYFSTLPIEAILEGVKEAGVACKISLSAGAFVCNHIFYRLQHRLKDSAIRSGFVHVPLVPEQSMEFPTQPVMSLHEMVRGAKALILSTINTNTIDFGRNN